MSRKFEAAVAERRNVNLFIGLCGPSSSGKTFSALRLASGIQKVIGGDIYFICTENRRSTFYSDKFNFKIVQFDPPHGSDDYAAAIQHCEDQGAKIIVIDSASHEHEGAGGLLDQHEAELDRMAGSDFNKRERVKLLAWQRPKTARRKLLRKIITSKANILMCFRCKHISKPVKVNGKTEVVDQGFVPIAGEEFVFEMQLCAMLPPNSQGVPNWNPEQPGERMAVKLPQQFKPMIKDGEALSEELGVKLAEWARGGAKATQGSVSSSDKAPAPAGPMHTPETLDFALSDCETADDLKATWKALEARLPKEPPDALLACQAIYKARLAKIRAGGKPDAASTAEA